MFLIGFRINQIRDVRRWLSVGRAMPRTLRELAKHPEIGFLHAESFFTPPQTFMVQYCKSYEHPERCAPRSR